MRFQIKWLQMPISGLIASKTIGIILRIFGCRCHTLSMWSGKVYS